MKENVKRGAALLDAKKPGWREKIDKSSLDLANGWQCVLGQVYGDYAIGINTLGLHEFDKRVAHGFTSPLTNMLDRAERMKELTKAWLEVL